MAARRVLHRLLRPRPPTWTSPRPTLSSPSFCAPPTADFHASASAHIEGGGGNKKGIKRFYETVSVVPTPPPEAATDDNKETETADDTDAVSDDASAAWQVLLDKRTLRSPALQPLRLPTEALATAVAIEWDSMGEMVEPHNMPLMSAVSTVTDHLPANRELYGKELLKYLDTDTVCIRAPPHEGELYELQRETWDPLVDWMEEAFGASLATTSAVGKPRHDPASLEAVKAHVETLTDFELQALFLFTNVCKSLTIGLALVHGRLGIDEAVAAARLEEEYQIDQWGMVEGGHDVDRAHINVQLAAGRVLLRTARS